MGNYKPVSAAEKYAEVGENRPVCECHGEPRRWSRETRYRQGGTWIKCAVVKDDRVQSWKKATDYIKKKKARYVASGKCITCGLPSHTKFYCYRCSLIRSENKLRRRMLA